MKTHLIKAEVINLKGEKVYISKDYNKMDMSKLANNVYMVNYIDGFGNIVWSERFVKGRKMENLTATN